MNRKAFYNLLELKFELQSYAHTLHGNPRRVVEQTIREISGRLQSCKHYDLFMGELALAG